MKIEKIKNGSNLEIVLSGRLDTSTSPQLEEVVKNDLTGINDLKFNFKELEYVSSAGLRILLSSQKIMNQQGKMVITNVNDDIKEVFEITGFIDILTIE